MKIFSSIPTIILLTSCLAPIEVTDNPSDFSSQKIRAAQVNCMQAPPPQMPITYKNNPVINYEDYFDCVDDEISKNVDIEKVNTISLYEEISEDPIDVEQSDTKVNIPKCVIDPDTEKYYNCSNLN